MNMYMSFEVPADPTEARAAVIAACESLARVLRNEILGSPDGLDPVEGHPVGVRPSQLTKFLGKRFSAEIVLVENHPDVPPGTVCRVGHPLSGPPDSDGQLWCQPCNVLRTPREPEDSP